MKNKYQLENNFVKFYYQNKKKEKFIIFIDKEDFLKICNNSWTVSKKGKRYYVYCNINKKRVYLHQLILQYDSSKYTCDHINLDALDNRKINLRICTKQQNIWNRDIMITNKSGTTGVHFNKRNKKWVAQIYIKRKIKHLGTFLTLKEAIQIRKEAEKIEREGYCVNK